MTTRATRAERRQALPGDSFIRDAAGAVMHAVTIAAPPESVWPWLMQMGAGRAGWYSYDWVDNDGQPSATTIIPALQYLTVGDIMPSLPGDTESFVVAAIATARDLVLTVAAEDGGNLVSWEFFLEPIEIRSTRLMVRGRIGALWPGAGALPAAPRPIERIYWLLAHIPRSLMMPAAMYGHGLMQARQLQQIKRRAEAAPHRSERRKPMHKIALAAGVFGVALGGLWLLQGLGAVHVRPILCFADCGPVQGPSLTWSIIGLFFIAAAVFAIFFSLKRRRR